MDWAHLHWSRLASARLGALGAAVAHGHHGGLTGVGLALTSRPHLRAARLKFELKQGVNMKKCSGSRRLGRLGRIALGKQSRTKQPTAGIVHRHCSPLAGRSRWRSRSFSPQLDGRIQASRLGWRRRQSIKVCKRESELSRWAQSLRALTTMMMAMMISARAREREREREQK